MQGTHQLANKLSSRGSPVARSADVRPGTPATAGGSTNAGTSRFTSCERIVGSGGWMSRHAKAQQHPDERE